MSTENSNVSEVFLGIIAVATLVMALAQVGFIFYGWTVARRVSRMLDQIEQEMRPVLEGLNAMARDAARASALAAIQVERVDRFFTDLTERIDQTATTVQRAIIMPLREGAAVMAAIRAVFSLIKDVTRRPGATPGTDDEDALFIG